MTCIYFIRMSIWAVSQSDLRTVWVKNMRRECTERENQIIRKFVSELLPDQTFSEGNIGVMVPAVLGIILGLAVGTPIALAIKSPNKYLIQLVLGISIIIMENICIFTWREWQERKTGKRRKKEISATGAFQVNGGTVLNYFRDDREGSWLLFAEDDLLDPFGKTYIIEYPVCNMGDIKPGERILLVYCHTGDYIPVHVNALTREMIPMQSPAYFAHTDWNTCTCLPHPNAVLLDRKAYHVNEKETAEFGKKCRNRKGMHARQIIGIVMLSILLLFIFAFIFIMLVAGEVIKTPEIALVAAIGLFTLWGLLAYGMAHLTNTGLSKGFHKFHFRKKVLFHSVSITDYNVPVKNVTVYEYDSGTIKRLSYPVNNLFLPKDLIFGTVIYKYSTKEDSKIKDVNYFVTIDEH